MTTGLPPEAFWDNNIFKNTSDDTIWLSFLESNKFTVKDVYTFKQNCASLGITLTLDMTRDITQAEYLSKFVSPPNEEDSADLQSWRYWKISALARANKIDPNDKEAMKQFDNPRFLVKQNVTAINMRRTAIRYYQGSEQRYLWTMIERDCGHAQVCAFRRGLYCEIAQSYCDGVNQLLAQHNIFQRYEVRWELQGSNAVKTPHVIQVNPRWKEQSLSPRQLAVLTRIKQEAKFPSYIKVIDVHMNIKDRDPQAHEIFLAKLAKGPKGWDSIIRSVTDQVTSLTMMIPEAWAERFMPGVEAVYPDNPFFVQNDWVAKFTLSSLMKEMPLEKIDYAIFAKRIAEGPWGGITNTILAWERWNDPQWREDFLINDPRLYQGMVILISVIYFVFVTGVLEYWVKGIPVIGSLWVFYAWTFWGLKKVYGLSNTVYYHSKGKSSTVISSMMPKDQFLVSKRIAAVIVDFCPTILGYCMIPLGLACDLACSPFEQGSRLYKKGNELKQADVKNTNITNPWMEFATPYVEKLSAQPNKRAYVAAPTATGKSALFPAAILGQRNKNGVARIWLVMPTIALRDEYNPPFKLKIQKLHKGVRRSRAMDMYVLTYGHFLNNMEYVDVENDIVLFDEFHMMSGEMVLAESKCKARIFLMSATPKDIPSLKGTITLMPPIKKRFETTIYKTNGDIKTINLFQMAKNQLPDLIDRSLIVEPTKRGVRDVIAQLQYLGHRGTEFSSDQRDVPKTGVIVATPYVDAGTDIKPPVDVLIDSGKMLVIDRGQKPKIVWTDPDTNKQRIGRPSRLKPGYVVQPKEAGTGTPVLTYPGGFMFEHKVISDVFKVPPLTPHFKLPAIDKQVPYLHINEKMLENGAQVKSLFVLHLLSLTGERETKYKELYNRICYKERFKEEEWWLERILGQRIWSTKDMLPWEEALTLLSIQDVSAYAIDNAVEYRKPIRPVKGVWQDSFIDSLAYEEATLEPMEPLDGDSKLRRMNEILRKTQSVATTIQSKAMQTTLFANASVMMASLAQN